MAVLEGVQVRHMALPCVDASICTKVQWQIANSAYEMQAAPEQGTLLQGATGASRVSAAAAADQAGRAVAYGRSHSRRLLQPDHMTAGLRGAARLAAQSAKANEYVQG